MSSSQQQHTKEEKRRSKVQEKLAPFVTNFSQWLQGLNSATLFDSYKYLVAVDVGATNTRVSVHFYSSKDEKGFDLCKVTCTCTKKLISILSIVGELTIEPLFKGKHAEAAVLAVAGPVLPSGTEVTITNYKGEKHLTVQALPDFFFPNERTKFLNDLEAACYGILSVGIKHELNKYFGPAFPDPKENVIVPDNLQNNHYLVLAMGTGLGAGLLFSLTYKQSWHNADPTFDIIPLEAGHCTITYPGYSHDSAEKEAKRLKFLSEKLYDGGKHAIEFEDICSGRGLKACYLFESGNEATPTEVAKRALSGEDEHAERAMFAHYQYLMKAAQNVCVMMPSCKGLFFAGDNQVSNDAFVQKNASQFKESFLQHPKREWLEKVTSYRQIKSINLNLAGAVYYMKSYLVADK